MIGIGLALPLVGRPLGDSYAGHNTVSFNQDYLKATIQLGSYAANWLPSTATGFLVAAGITLPALPAAEWYLVNAGRGTAAGKDIGRFPTALTRRCATWPAVTPCWYSTAPMRRLT